MKITSHIFQAYLKCKTKCWFIFFGKTGKGNEYDVWVKDRNDSYYGAGIKRLVEGLQQNEYVFKFGDRGFEKARWRLAARGDRRI